jgi:hypothetical protein
MTPTTRLDVRLRLYSPVGVQPVDSFTGQAPIGRVRATLETEDGKPTNVKAVLTPSGVLTYPGLGRRSHVDWVDPVRYLLKLEADYYRPFYRWSAGGIAFTAWPYNDEKPPQTIPLGRQLARLLPAANYPFPGHVPVVRGLVKGQADGKAVADALVLWFLRAPRGAMVRHRVLSDERGAFSLPLANVTDARAVLLAFEARPGRRTGRLVVPLPGGLSTTQTIEIS